MKGKSILPLIVISQFFCVSLWFAGNSVFADLAEAHGWGPGYLAQITSIVQFGFIAGTLLFALFTIADRFSPSKVFFASAVIAALFNAGICLPSASSGLILLFRFLTGFFLAGIYPVGMKIASDYYRKGLGKSLGFLVGALVLGTAFPHLLKSFTSTIDWRYVIFLTSLLSVAGGSLILIFVPDGPFRSPAKGLRINAFIENFGNKKFRSVAFGYFGHMWELYSFWAFIPVMLAIFQNVNTGLEINIPLLSFLIIGIGSIACVAAGIISQYTGTHKTATIALFLSCCCCFASPLFLMGNNLSLFLAFLFFWSFVVIADSPLFSTMVAQNANETSRGTSLTIVNSIGFSITIISLQVINLLSREINPQFIYMFLAIGPVLGLWAMFNQREKNI